MQPKFSGGAGDAKVLMRNLGRPIPVETDCSGLSHYECILFAGANVVLAMLYS